MATFTRKTISELFWVTCTIAAPGAVRPEFELRPVIHTMATTSSDDEWPGIRSPSRGASDDSYSSDGSTDERVDEVVPTYSYTLEELIELCRAGDKNGVEPHITEKVAIDAANGCSARHLLTECYNAAKGAGHDELAYWLGCNFRFEDVVRPAYQTYRQGRVDLAVRLAQYHLSQNPTRREEFVIESAVSGQLRPLVGLIPHLGLSAQELRTGNNVLLYNVARLRIFDLFPLLCNAGLGSADIEQVLEQSDAGAHGSSLSPCGLYVWNLPPLPPESVARLEEMLV